MLCPQGPGSGTRHDGTDPLYYIDRDSSKIIGMKTLDDLSSAVPLRTETAPSILVVDDEGAVRRFAHRVLEREGYSVVEARDGVEAVELIKNGGTFDAVVSDIVMPRMNGVELMQTLSTTCPDIPVILMSGYATSALAELGIAAPCAILPKPFPAERLLEEVRRCTRKRDRT
jgi:two-component system, cell cycle sensor histidine kinase and response regulator CckA